MRVSVVINPKAGNANSNHLEEKIRDALFRCDVQILHSKSLQDVENFLAHELEQKTDAVMVCGGDGTINSTLQILMKQHLKNQIQLPPLCVVCSGTANDLAAQIGITNRVDRAARNILEGEIKKIDIIEISHNGDSKYMLTNGGLGIPALTADKANLLREKIQRAQKTSFSNPLLQKLVGQSGALVKKMGSAIYSVLLLETLKDWKQEGWELEVEIENQEVIISKAPFVMINNQPAVGKNFITAPYTMNSDGKVNLLLMDARDLATQLVEIARFARGRVNEGSVNQVFEATHLVIRSRNPERKLTFFGDGEILFRDVSELSVRCLKQALPVVVRA